MTQDKFDRRFTTAFKASFGTMLVGAALAIFIGLPVFAITGHFQPLVVATVLTIVSGSICVGNFAHDIVCNPRWRR